MDVQDRDGKERRLGRIIGRLLAEQLTRLLEEVVEDDDTVNFDSLPPDFWDTEVERFVRALSPEQQRIFLEQAEAMLAQTSIGVEWGQVNEQAVVWARNYTYDLVTGINGTNRSTLQRLIARSFEEPLTQGELRELLSGTYSPVRAEMIARTEVTRAAVEGERAFVRGLERQGVQLTPVHVTRADDIVCPICGPRNDQPIERDDQFPPLHPRCRCWVNWVTR